MRFFRRHSAPAGLERDDPFASQMKAMCVLLGCPLTDSLRIAIVEGDHKRCASILETAITDHDHLDLVEAIASGDVERTQRAFVAHLKRVAHQPPPT